MLGNTLTIKNMVKELSHGKMERFMKGNGPSDINMEKEL